MNRTSDSKGKLHIISSLNRPSAHIWKSRLSWRIATVVFLTILTVQLAILALTVPQEEDRLLNEIKEIGRSAIAPIIENKNGFLKSPISKSMANRAISSTIVNGMDIYTSDYLLLAHHGEQTVSYTHLTLPTICSV